MYVVATHICSEYVYVVGMHICSEYVYVVGMHICSKYVYVVAMMLNATPWCKATCTGNSLALFFDPKKEDYDMCFGQD